MEQWKDIENYKGLYQVSNWGRVKSLPRTIFHVNGGSHKKIGGILKFKLTKRGYLWVNLVKNGKSRKNDLHKLVSQAFLDNPNNLAFIEHKDGIWTNNEATNLKWVNRKERR